MEPVLSVRNLSKTFFRRGAPPVQAVDGVSFDLMPGECLGVIGESGSGKSTLASLIARLQEPTAGEILLNGENITHASGRRLREIYRKMQMVFQTPEESFDPRQRLGSGILESLRNSGMPVSAAQLETERLLQRCGLPPELSRRYPHEVSGGQCQRAAIARAIAVKPALLLCDEATSALDVTIQQDILALLHSLQAELGLTILFICHDIALVQQFCGRVLVMHEGRIVEQGDTDAVIRHPRDAYTKHLLDSVL